MDIGEPRYISVDGINTRYFESGTGTPLILVHGGHHGFVSSAQDWELNAGLADDFRLISVDKLGMGHTDNPPSSDSLVMSSTVQHLTRFIDTVDARGAWLVGHSRGGYAVTRVALERPDMVSGVAIVASGTLFSKPNPIYDQWQRESQQFSDPGDRLRYEMRMNSFRDAHITKSIIESRLAIQRLEKTQRVQDIMASGGYDRFKEELAPQQEEAVSWIREGRLSLPTLVLWGFNDPSARMERAGLPALDAIMNNVPDSEMHIFNQAGHYVYREHAEAFNEVLTGFVRRRTNAS